jgi:membrane protease YdiL (CAAX protease family)
LSCFAALDICVNLLDHMNDASSSPTRKAFIASPWHTLSILLFFALMVYLDAHHGQNAVASGAGVSHEMLVRGYLLSIFFACGMAYWCWVGVHWKGGTLRDLTGGRWTSWQSVATDFAIAIPFWMVWELTARLMHRLVDRVASATTPYQPPAGLQEILLWIVVSVAAGIGEEIIFRGYLQQQFHAATRSLAVAVVLQGLVFGLVHTYQGWKQVMVIVPLGILYGALVAWRRNLRASMIAHAWSDIFEGWLRFL